MANHRVLIVEDEQDIAGVIKHTLERNGETEAQIVGSGDAAIRAVTDRPPDVIILDLNLPVVSGLDVCRILRARADVPRVPIIMLTARTCAATCAGLAARLKRWLASATGSWIDRVQPDTFRR